MVLLRLALFAAYGWMDYTALASLHVKVLFIHPSVRPWGTKHMSMLLIVR